MTATITWTPASGTGTQKVYYRLSTPGGPYILYSTLTASASSETITGLSDDALYDFKIENNCGVGIPGIVIRPQLINISCPTLSLTSTTSSISYSFVEQNSTDIGSYTISLYNSSNSLITATSLSYTTGGATLSGSFGSLSPSTTYKVGISITPTVGSSKTCTLQLKSTIATGWNIVNIDYANHGDTINGTNTTSGPYVVTVFNNTTSTYIVGDATGASGAFDGLLAGQSQTISSIPSGDDFVVAAYKRKGSPTFYAIDLATKAWIQLRNASNAIVDIAPGDPQNAEERNSVNLTGFNIATGFTTEVREQLNFIPSFPVQMNTTPGRNRRASLSWFDFVGSGIGLDFGPQDTFGVFSGGNYNSYQVYNEFARNPFKIYPTSAIVGDSSYDPDGYDIFTITGNVDNAGPGIYKLGNKTYLFKGGTTYKGEGYTTIPFVDLVNTGNMGVAWNSSNPINNNGPTINSITRSGSNLTINYTWTSYDGTNNIGENPGSWGVYAMVIKNPGLSSETVTHTPLTTGVTWTSNNISAMPYSPLSSFGATSSITISVTIPPSFVSLKVKLYYIYPDSTNPTVGVNDIYGNFGSVFSI